jgi:hypothetical protein
MAGAAAASVRVDDLEISVDLAGGRTIVVPIAWFPRLAHGSQTERAKWRIIGGGHGIHWPDLDEDISVEMYRSSARLPEVVRFKFQTRPRSFRIDRLSAIESG